MEREQYMVTVCDNCKNDCIREDITECGFFEEGKRKKKKLYSPIDDLMRTYLEQRGIHSPEQAWIPAPRMNRPVRRLSDIDREDRLRMQREARGTYTPEQEQGNEPDEPVEYTITREQVESNIPRAESGLEDEFVAWQNDNIEQEERVDTWTIPYQDWSMGWQVSGSDSNTIFIHPEQAEELEELEELEEGSEYE